MKIIRKFQKVAKEHHLEHASHKARRSCYIGNLIRTKRRKNQQQREAAKGTATLYTFWGIEKSIKENDATGELSDASDYKIEDNNWNNKILTALENLELDITKENIKSEVWVRLNCIRFYLQLVKCDYSRMDASKVVANVAGKGIYYARCIRS